MYINTPNELSLSKPHSANKNCDDNIIEKLKIEEIECNEKILEKNLTYWAVKILKTPDPKEKANLTIETAKKWFDNEINEIGNIAPIAEPNRLASLNIVDPGKIRRGKGGTLASRIALLHSLANIEQWAIDLSWDIIARFANTEFSDKTKLPKEFIDDFVKVATDEAKVLYFN